MMEKTTKLMGFKYRIYPTKKQRLYFEQCFHWCWWFYRFVLHHYEDDYRFAKQNYSDNVLCWFNGASAYHPNWLHVSGKSTIPKEFYRFGAPIRSQTKGERNSYTLVKKARSLRPVFNEVPVVILQSVIGQVESAYNMFFKGVGGFPNYPKERDYTSLKWTNSVNFSDKKVHSESCKFYETSKTITLSKVPGHIRIKYHRPMKGMIKQATVSRDILGQYYVSLLCEFNPEPVQVGIGAIGIDMNIKALDSSTRSFITCSNGVKVDIPRWDTQSEEKITKISRKISACVDSAKQKKLYRILKHEREKIKNKKFNWLHNLTARIVRENGYIIIEDIQLTGFHKKRDDPTTATNMELAGDRGSRKAWREAPFGEFVRQLEYKGGDRVIKVNPANTSKLCNCCGFLNDALTLEQREWVCPKCGVSHDRDVNAAKNILARGLGSPKGKSDMIGTETPESNLRAPAHNSGNVGNLMR